MMRPLKKIKHSISNEKEKPWTILQAFSHYLSMLDKSTGIGLAKDFQKLVSLNDDLISLMLENAYLDHQYHGLNIAPSSMEMAEDVHMLKSGEFDGRTRTISVASDLPIKIETFMHELAHAATFFLFKPSPLTFGVSVPHAQKAFRDRRDLFNPAELKFKQCVREDKENLNVDLDSSLFSAEIDDLHSDSDNFTIRKLLLNYNFSTFFSHIEMGYDPDIYSEKSLAEIFPFYINIRTSLLLLANDFYIDKSHAIAVLERRLPRLHDYFETDIKRLLKNRLRDLLDDVGHGYESSCVTKTTEMSSVTKADLNIVIRGFWHERLERATGYSFFVRDKNKKNEDGVEDNQGKLCKQRSAL